MDSCVKEEISTKKPTVVKLCVLSAIAAVILLVGWLFHRNVVILSNLQDSGGCLSLAFDKQAMLSVDRMVVSVADRSTIPR